MAFVADGIDFLANLFSSNQSDCKSGGGVNHSGLKGANGITYFAVTFMWLMVWHKVSQKDFSAIITAAATVQCLGFVLLTMKVRATRSVAGISSKTLVMYVLCLCIRLCSTTIKKGYIPVDRSGHYFYQFMDMCTVALAMQLIFLCHKTYQHSYQEEHDTMPLLPLIIPSFILSCCVHGNLNRNLFFDIVWFFSLNLETVMMIPQLWMMSKIGGKVNGFSAQFVATNMLKNVMTFTFWSWAYTELADKETGANMVGNQIMLAYVVQLLLGADFMFYYAKGMLEGTDGVVLPSTDGIEM